MFSLKSLLNAIGVKISDENVKQLEDFLPKIPAKINEIINYNVRAVAHFDEQLKEQKRLMLELHDRLGKLEIELHGQARSDSNSDAITSVGSLGDGCDA